MIAFLLGVWMELKNWRGETAEDSGAPTLGCVSRSRRGRKGEVGRAGRR